MAITSHVTSLALTFLITGIFLPFDHRPPPLTSGNCKSDLYELEPFRILLNYIYFFSHEFPVCFLLEYSFFSF